MVGPGPPIPRPPPPQSASQSAGLFKFSSEHGQVNINQAKQPNNLWPWLIETFGQQASRKHDGYRHG